MSRAARTTALAESISSEREAEVAEAVRWLVDRYGYEQTEAQLLYAVAICRRLEAEDGDADE